jgi:hypothetical protein
MLRWYFNRRLSASVSWNRWASEGAGVSVATCRGALAAAAATEALRRRTDRCRVTVLRRSENESCDRAGRSGSIERPRCPFCAFAAQRIVVSENSVGITDIPVRSTRPNKTSDTGPTRHERASFISTATMASIISPFRNTYRYLVRPYFFFRF